jgi:hypothetical protein
MSNKMNFTDGEWKLLCMTPLLTGLYIIAADFDFISFAREFKSMTEIINDSAVQFEDNELIQSVIARNVHNLKDVEDFERLSEMKGEYPPEPMKAVASILDSKAEPEEAHQFKIFLTTIAEKIAGVSGEGIMGTGEGTSGLEYDRLAQLEDELGL